ncbi:MAG: aldehyde dehydrogenase [Burkholderiales bacterium RIFCSPLOWO2_12_FULL_64_99]|jgi:aldehyde dehydrogenase|uniref:acetaldehyde dehydrogenase ExaC n=1 Tax=Aquabacterium sp. TaxID=1872578 RepID=UPI0008D68438|nr:MAG: aldehyde dehydrogenase [Burkholderiales bacterium RIFCSPHIGHO2_12_FULL_63_20]OGB64280.1 MAG: aldehyde dehydrogenase [Burkholderiales bacterium RIFCSPLOWO2_12_FULL_64_99]
MIYAAPGAVGAPVAFKSRYDNFIGGKFVAPLDGQYFDVITPISGKVYTQAARSTEADINLALDAAHAAKDAWGATAPAERAGVLLKIADRLEQNLEKLAYAETVDNGKPIRETLNADIPLAVDHFRYFAGCLRAQEGSLSEIDGNTIAYHFHEPLGVVGQIIPWNFPILMAAWKLAPALAAGNCVVLKPAESTPVSILVLAELIADLLPAGVLNIVNGMGREAGMPLASSKRIAKIAFTGSTATGRVIAQAAASNLIPATLELGGKSPNIFFDDVMAQDDAFLDKAIEGMVLFAFNQGEVCTCPSRALIQESIYDRFIERAIQRVAAIKQGSPLDTDTMMGAQASALQMDKIMSYMAVGKEEGAQVLIGGDRAQLGGELSEGYYIQPTLFKGHNQMRIFREEIFGPVLAVTTFRDEAEAMAIANDTPYGLGAGVWTRDGSRAYRFGRGIQAGRVWTNCYHAYPAHATFGGYKESGIGRETHKMMLDHYQQTKNLLVSYSPNKLGFF